MKRGSFEAINYALRPNKNVERKLIAQALIKLRREFGVDSYRYVGFGSMWFADFVLMHKAVGISDMVTIENQVSRKKRVEFNKPFACISVRMEQASTALGEVIDQEKPCIAWLDYDGPLKDAMTGDLETAIGGMASGSIILVTVNANVDQLKGHKKDDEELSPEAFLADICDDEELLMAAHRLTRNDFPQLVCELIHSRLKSAVLKLNPACEYFPLWTFRYSDGVAMVTAGGMVANAEDRKKLDVLAQAGVAIGTQDTPFEIQLPILTEKEKRALDRLLPAGNPLDYRRLDFELREVEVAAYEKFYLHYPVFSEIAS